MFKIIIGVCVVVLLLCGCATYQSGEYRMTITTMDGDVYSGIDKIVYNADDDTVRFELDGQTYEYFTHEIHVGSMFGQVMFEDHTPIILHDGYGESIGIQGATTTITDKEICDSYFTAVNEAIK